MLMTWCGPASRFMAASLAREGDNPFQPVVHLKGRILQVRKVGAGETVGYGATHTLKRPSRVAIVSVGYADGFFRSLSHKDGQDGLRRLSRRARGADPRPCLDGSDHR